MLYGNSSLGKTELVREIAAMFFNGKCLEKHLSMFKNNNYSEYFFGDAPNRRSLGFDLLERESNLVFFDELDKSLHPELLIYLVRLFNDKKINKGNGQLVFTAHNDILLDSSYNIFRDYQIYFMNKNSRQMSELYSLYEFSDILKNYKKKNIAKLYRKGLFGARPVLEDFYWRE